MASIHQSVVIDVPPAQAWDALRDVGALHTRLVKGFVTDCRLEGETRIVTFANGLVAHERIVSVDDTKRRVAWSATGERLSHHNASAQVVDEAGGRSRLVWIADLLPHEMAPAIAGMIEQGLAAMKRTLEAAPG
jgi:carbon monoxide dehydrogenase subunit G